MSKPLIFLAGFALGATVMFVLDRSEIIWRRKPIVNQEPKPEDKLKDVEPDTVEPTELSPKEDPHVVFSYEDVFEDRSAGAGVLMEAIHVDGIPDDPIEDGQQSEAISLDTLLGTNISGEGTTGNSPNTENNEQQK